jgi:hypothetical protein
MITCPFCGADQVANTIFCNDCGHYLLQGEDKGTNALKTGEINYSGYFQKVDRPLELPQKPAQQVVLYFKITPQVVIEVRLEKEVLIGRMDPTTTVFPTIDLSTAGAAAKSVSRRHARIIKREEEIVLEDLGSVNGTCLNDQRLAPFLPVPLNDGDVLQLGQLSIEARIQYQ